jgi:hypothetical protein
MAALQRSGAGLTTFPVSPRDALTFPYRFTTFTHCFARVGSDAHCHDPGRSGTCRSRIRWCELGSPAGGGRDHPSALGRTLGTLVGRQSADGGSRGAAAKARRSRRRGIASGLGARSSGEKDRLGTGGAAAFAPVWSEGGDCQVPSRRVCLSLRGSAAGPEWRRTPVLRTLALGQRLGQLHARVFARLSHARAACRRVSRSVGGAKRARLFRDETRAPLAMEPDGRWGQAASGRGGPS